VKQTRFPSDPDRLYKRGLGRSNRR